MPPPTTATSNGVASEEETARLPAFTNDSLAPESRADSSRPTQRQVGEEPDEGRVVPRRGGAGELEPQVSGAIACGDVEIVEDLDVVADEADRRHDDLGRAGLRLLAERVEDVGLEPALLGRSTAALVDEPEARHPGRPSHQSGGEVGAGGVAPGVG